MASTVYTVSLWDASEHWSPRRPFPTLIYTRERKAVCRNISLGFPRARVPRREIGLFSLASRTRGVEARLGRPNLLYLLSPFTRGVCFENAGRGARRCGLRRRDTVLAVAREISPDRVTFRDFLGPRSTPEVAFAGLDLDAWVDRVIWVAKRILGIEWFLCLQEIYGWAFEKKFTLKSYFYFLFGTVDDKSFCEIFSDIKFYEKY